jgi:hypothetical protein
MSEGFLQEAGATALRSKKSGATLRNIIWERIINYAQFVACLFTDTTPGDLPERMFER